MKVFISWSGDRSRMLAEALREWLPLVINAVEPWISSVDISAGSRWNADVARNLEQSKFGIFCLTKENLASTWMHFEAGAISKHVSDSVVCTLLLGLTPDQVEWPLAQFQAKTLEKRHVLELVKSLNAIEGAGLLRADILQKSFDKWWPDLEEQVQQIPEAEPNQTAPQRSTESMLSEVLGLLRTQERRNDAIFPPAKVGLAAALSKTRLADDDTAFVNALIEGAHRSGLENVTVSNQGSKYKIDGVFNGGTFKMQINATAARDLTLARDYVQARVQQFKNLQDAEKISPIYADYLEKSN